MHQRARNSDLGLHSSDAAEFGHRSCGPNPEGAFERLFFRYYSELCAYANTYVQHAEDAEELVEDLFVWLWEHRAGWDAHTSVRQYLYSAVRNRALKHLRHARVRLRVYESTATSSAPPGMGSPPATPDEELTARELAKLVDSTIRALPDRCREAFDLSRAHGLTHAEIAHVMGISVSTVEKHVVRAVAELRDAIARS